MVNTVPPADLRRALEKKARNRNMTVNDMAVSIIAEYFGEEAELSGYEFRRPNAERLKVTVPQSLYRLLREERETEMGTLQGVTFSILAQGLGTKPVSTGRRPRRKK